MKEQCRRFKLIVQDCEDLFSSACLKLMENNYEKLRLLERDFSVSYLTKVIVHITIDIMRDESGRWRPSQQANRRGEAFVRLEELVCRDHFSFDEAYEILNMKYPHIAKSDLFDFFQETTKKIRGTHKDVGDDDCLKSLPSSDTSPEEIYVKKKDNEQMFIIRRLISETLSCLDAQTILVVKMVYNGGLSLSEAARAINQPRTKVESKVKGALSILKEKLLASGFGISDVISIAESAGEFEI